MADTASPDGENRNYRIRREASGAWSWLRGLWRERRWFRWLGYLALAGVLFLALIWVVFARDLPSVDQLRDFLEHGNIRNAVNFPSVAMPRESPWRVAMHSFGWGTAPR